VLKAVAILIIFFVDLRTNLRILSYSESYLPKIRLTLPDFAVEEEEEDVEIPFAIAVHPILSNLK
jgi:hypothetical protein